MSEIPNINVEQEKKPKKINMKVVIIGVIVLVVVLSIVIGLAVNSSTKERDEEQEKIREEERIREEEKQAELEQEYRERMIEAMAYMLINVSGGATYVSTYLDIIIEYPSLSHETVEGIMVSSFVEVMDLMEEYDGIVIADMKWLSNHKIDKFNDAYEVLLEMYDNYRVFYDGTTDLQVTTVSSTNRLLEKGQTVLEKYNRILIIMPELEGDVENKQDSITI